MSARTRGQLSDSRAAAGRASAMGVVRGMCVIVVLTALSGSPATAAQQVTLTQRDSSGGRTLALSAGGAVVTSSQRACARCRLRPLSRIVADYRRGRVLLVDPVHRIYALGALGALTKIARREEAKAARPVRIPGLGTLARTPRATLTALGTVGIAGLRARLYELRQGALRERLAYALDLPSPPSGVVEGLAGIAPGSNGRWLLRIEVNTNRRWTALLTTTSARRGRARALSLRAPRRYRRRPLSQVGSRARAASVPATLTNLGIGAISHHPRIFPIYWGSFFVAHPEVVRSMNARLRQMVEGSDGYMRGLAQYGVNPGSFGEGFTIPGDPSATIGGADFFSVEVMLLTHLGTNGTPRGWGRFDSADPIIMIFVPTSVVGSGGWGGYHFEVATEAGAFPWNHPTMPWTIVKFQDGTTPTNMIMRATEDASHEFVEAATDPNPFFAWSDLGKVPVWSEGEVSDICENASAPWLSETRLGGTWYSTYWSNRDAACVPESRPSPSIISPAAGSRWPCGHVELRASATDPFDGTVTDPSGFIWFDRGHQIATGIDTTVNLGSGLHSITVRVTDSRGQSRISPRASIMVTRPVPHVTISAPTAGSTWGTDQDVPFSGSATSSCTGVLSGSALSWSENGAVLGAGSTFTHRFSDQGQHTVTLTATSHGAATHADVTFTVGAPLGNPSPTITAPIGGTNQPDPAHVNFSGSATDPHDGPLAGAQLQWDDTYTDASSQVHSHVPLGTGQSFTASLYWNSSSPTQHVIRLVATDSLGHTAATSVTITVGTFS